MQNPQPEQVAGVRNSEILTIVSAYKISSFAVLGRLTGVWLGAPLAKFISPTDLIIASLPWYLFSSTIDEMSESVRISFSFYLSLDPWRSFHL